MYHIAMLDSGNFVFSLCRILERKGYVFEVVSIPCQIAKSGCGYCLKFPAEYMDLIIREGAGSNMPIREIFKVIPMFSKNKYEKVY